MVIHGPFSHSSSRHHQHVRLLVQPLDHPYARIVPALAIIQPSATTNHSQMRYDCESTSARALQNETSPHPLPLIIGQIQLGIIDVIQRI